MSNFNWDFEGVISVVGPNGTRVWADVCFLSVRGMRDDELEVNRAWTADGDLPEDWWEITAWDWLENALRIAADAKVNRDPGPDGPSRRFNSNLN